MTEQLNRSRKLPNSTIAALGLATAFMLWAYWSTLMVIVERWNLDPQYSHGFLVPGFAGYLLWLRRQRILETAPTASAWGLLFLGVALVIRLTGAYFHYSYLDQISLLPCVAGLFALAGGWTALAWSWPSVAFLAFMVPLPHSWSLALSGPMQGFATLVSTFLLQVLGRPALAEGNVILLNEIELGIVEACSGLRMLVVFFALSTAVALLVRKPLWEKGVIALSAVPIALASNILRITVTGLFYDSFGKNFGGALFHDLAGWLMMPLGLAFLALELWILKRLLLDAPAGKLRPDQMILQRAEQSPVSLYRGNTARRERAASPDAAAAPPSEAANTPSETMAQG